MRRVAPLAALTMLIAGCGAAAITPRSVSTITGCLHREGVAIRVIRGIKATTGPRLQAIVFAGSGQTSITVYATADQAAGGFAANSTAALLRAGNVIVGPNAPESTSGDLPSNLSEVTRCAFGPARASRSAAYVATYAHPNSGESVMLRSGCLACHRIGSQGENGPGQNLSDIGTQLTPAAITRAVTSPVAPMPSYQALRRLHPAAFRALVSYLSRLRTG